MKKYIRALVMNDLEGVFGMEWIIFKNKKKFYVVNKIKKTMTRKDDWNWISLWKSRKMLLKWTSNLKENLGCYFEFINDSAFLILILLWESLEMYIVYNFLNINLLKKKNIFFYQE
jgi:hypothetical protein